MERKLGVILWVIGLILALSAAYIMFHGSIFPENNSGIAIVMVIIGIGLISTGTPIWKKS
jgi:hypothetical protein